MAELYKFFNSTDSDRRVYQAEDFASYFSQFLSDGLYHQDGQPNLRVRANGLDKRIYVEEGSAIVRGHMYQNTSNLYLEVEESHPTLDRVDRIVLRYDGRIENRYIKLFVKTGEPSQIPSAPSLIRDGEVYELSLAQVFVPKNTSVVTNANITDERLSKDVCGITSSLITIPVDQMFENFEQFKQQLNDDFYEWFNDAIKQTSVELMQKELQLIKQNQLELLMERYIEEKSTSMDAGYFFDVFKDYSKINESQTTARINTIDMKAMIDTGSLEGQVTFLPHPVGFVTNRVKHFQTRPVGKMISLTKDALAGQNTIDVANVTITITEVI